MFRENRGSWLLALERSQFSEAALSTLIDHILQKHHVVAKDEMARLHQISHANRKRLAPDCDSRKIVGLTY